MKSERRTLLPTHPLYPVPSPNFFSSLSGMRTTNVNSPGIQFVRRTFDVGIANVGFIFSFTEAGCCDEIYSGGGYREKSVHILTPRYKAFAGVLFGER
ncbi:hypothetical protein CDAR_195091 [Caerostris darwini]|uniref:Uncharacterized protein n=1 Tax=Caerostris darwini TaxID=1538125 RepID=A0AAV4X945_9ARAC|nr:hypothetical protein CDAR_195091 [Caerostris darwini]